jgi:hypothetical protein
MSDFPSTLDLVGALPMVPIPVTPEWVTKDLCRL